MFCACDYVGNLYIAAVGKNLPKGTDRTTQLLHFRLQSTVLMFDCAEVDNRSKVVFVWSTQSCDSLMGLSVAKEKLLIPFR